MSKVEDGGAAFPGTADNYCREGEGGMSLRDYFAAKALQGFIAGAMSDGSPRSDCDISAKVAYMFSDAMLLARSKP